MLRTATICLCLIVALQQIHAEETALASLKNKYDTGVRRIRREHEVERERLLETYGTALDNAIETLRKGGDPDPVLLAVAEKRRFESDRSVPKESQGNRLPGSVRKVQTGYHEAERRAEIAAEKKCADLTERYVAMLDRLMRQYTNEDKLDLAMNVKSEKKRAEFILAEIESILRKLQKTSSRTTPPPARLGQDLSIDLGGGVKMELVWIQALKMWVGKYEVTNGQYRRMAPNHDSRRYERHSLNGDRQPVVWVNFDDARKYAAWLTQKLQSVGALPADCRFRLPTEREWMTFAQCGDNRKYPWGDDGPPQSGRGGELLRCLECADVQDRWISRRPSGHLQRGEERG